jgi:hypothetical protein
VINLEATEVEAQSASAEPRVDPPDDRQQPAPPAATPDDAVAATEDAPAQVASEPLATPPPAPESPPPPEPPSGSPSGARSSSDGPASKWLPEELSWTQAGAGIAGAAGGFLLFLLLWLVGAFSGGGAPPADLSPRLAAIEMQVASLAARPAPARTDAKALEQLSARMAGLESALAARPAPARTDPKALEQLSARVAGLESAQSAPRAPVTDPVVLGRLGATERSIKSIADNVAALSRRGDGVEGTLREANDRLDRISATLKEMQTTARAAAVGSDRAARLAVAAESLRDAVERGAPFSAELAVVRPLTKDSAALAPLEPFATSGVPGDTALGKELAAVIRPLLRATDASPREEGILGRLQAGAEKLVRIRRVDQPRRVDARGATLARIEQMAARAEVSGALKALAELPAAEREPMQGWIAKVQARDKAVEATRRFAADAVAALKATP